MENGVSVVICCYNSSKRLPATLQHLAKQITNGIAWEVIIVDNASTDNTVDIGKQYADQFMSVTNYQVIKETNPGLSYARSLGIQTARFDHVLFCDDDNWLSSNYISVAYTTMQNKPGVGACGGRGIPVFETAEPFWFKDFLRPYAVGRPRNNTGVIDDKMSFLTGAGMMFSLKLWNNITTHGFRSLLSDRQGKSLSSGGDVEMCYIFRLSGYELYYLDEISYQHFIPAERLSLSYLERLHQGIGRASAYLSAYQHVLNDLPIDKSFHWIRVLGLLASKFVRLTLVSQTGVVERMENIAFKSYYSELFRLKGKYDDAIRRIYRISNAVKNDDPLKARFL